MNSAHSAFLLCLNLGILLGFTCRMIKTFGFYPSVAGYQQSVELVSLPGEIVSDRVSCRDGYLLPVIFLPCRWLVIKKKRYFQICPEIISPLLGCLR